MKKKNDEIIELTPEEIEAKKLARRKKAKRKKVWTVIDRIFGFILATGIMFGLGGLALEYVLVKGPSPALKDTFVMTMLETRRFGFISNVFLSEAEVQEIKDKTEFKTDQTIDTSMINIPSGEEAADGEETSESQYPEDEDGDGYILEEIKRKNFVGYMLTVLDPSRVFVGMPQSMGGYGATLKEMCERYDAIGGINGGGFVDNGGAGLGGSPRGLTIVDGVCYNEGYGGDSFVGFDSNNIMHVGYFSLQDVQNVTIRDGVCFQPILIMNGEPMSDEFLASGVNPRTAIGQRSDGAVLMLVIDGRQAHSVGCTYRDLADIMLDYGAVNAINLDGGSSTTMYLNGEYVNSSSAGSGDSRAFPTAFLFK